MRIIQVTDYQEMSKKAALMMASQITLKPDTVLGLATGETPIGMYQELISLYERNQLDCSEVVTFNLDEYLGLSADHEQSYHYYMKKHFFEPIH
ncbi:MAG: glucosamine-6-phosphate deaminase, partial [Clostridiales bacterium]|nr:glucosamine-6-phosphate deaminase [Clostridiales bacterium]